MADIDTHIDASPENITAAADWLGKLKKGFDEARSSLVNTMSDRSEISGEFGRALNEYVNDLGNGCWSASSELKATIDVINSWHDQVVWRKQDMAGYRDDAKAGGLTVENDRYIKQPEAVSNPGDLPKNATSKQKSTWQSAHNEYESYLTKKKLWDDLRGDVNKTRTQLTDWVKKNMTVQPDPPLYEQQMNAWKNAGTSAVEFAGENIYHNEAYKRLLRNSVSGATTRYRNGSPSPKQNKGISEPNRKAVANRTRASAAGKAVDMDLAGKAKTAGKAAGIATTLALAGLDIYNGKSPSQTGVETAAGFAGAALGVAMVGVGAAALGVAAPGILAVGAAVTVGTVLAWGAGKVYETSVPLRTRERIDEGIKDAWNATAGSAWKSVFG